MQNTTKRLSNNINFLAIKPNTVHSLEHQNIPSNQTMIQFFSTIPVQLPYTLSKEKLTKRNASRVAKEKKKKKKLENRHSFLPDCIRSTMSSCRWWDAIVGEYIYIYMLHPHNPHFQGWNTIFRINDGTIHKIGKYVVASADTRRKLNGRVWASVVVVEHARGVIAQKWSAPVFERRVSV